MAMDGIFVDGIKQYFKPEDILESDASAYTEQIAESVNDWLEENVTGGEQVTDTTLSLSGVPADAKVTGDTINDLSDSVDTEIDALKEDLSTLNTEGTAPTSEQMLSDNYTEDSVPYHFRKTASDNADREELEIVGGSVAWNQFAPISSSAGQTVTKDGISITFNTDGSILLNGTTNARGQINIMSVSASLGNLISNHVYFIHNCPVGGANDTYYGGVAGIVIDTGNGGLFKHTYEWISSQLRFDYYSGVTFNNAKFYPQYIDLTQALTPTIADHIYSLEQATAGAGVALFKSLFPKDYYAYDAGSIQSVTGLSEHRIVGFNQWDEEWEAYSTSQIKSKNRIKLISGATYYAKTPSMGVTLYFKAQESDSANVGQINVTNNTFVVPANANYAVLYTNVNYGTTYKNDVCINLSDPAKNGTYEPYQKHSYTLDDSLTLRGIPTLVDSKIKWDGDVYSPSGKVTRRCGIVDLGTLNWLKSTQLFYNTAATSIPSYGLNGNMQVISTKYTYAGGTGVSYSGKPDKTIYYDWNQDGVVCIADSAYTDAATFKTAMSGVYLVYELATPTTEQADPYVSPQICSPYGTEEFVSTGIVPVGHNTKYPDNMRAKLDGLPWNFASLIAPTESGFKATRNYTTGALLIVNNVLYKATANIANGATITVGTNVTATTLAEVIAALS